MARIRSVKPELWLDRKLARLVSRDARLLYIGLWNYSDEHCRLHGDPAVVKGQVFPYDDDVDVAALLDELVVSGRVRRYEVDDDPYLYLPKLAKHQRLEPGKSASRLPAPPPLVSEPTSAPATIRPENLREAAQEFSAIPEPVPTDPVDNAVDNMPDSASSQVRGTIGENPREARPIVAQQVAGSREHVAGSKWQGGDSATTVAAPKPKRGHRLPDDWQPTPELIAWAKTECPGIDDRTETEKFRNHWLSKTGRDATKHDWGLTWKNWLLRARDEYGGSRAAPNGSRASPKPSTTDQRVADGLALAARLRAEEDP
jgi:hypothetical protein